MQAREAPSRPSGLHSQYDDKEKTKAMLAKGRHRNLVGAMWERMGQLQLDFLKSAGLLPQHTLLDIGCGCLRAGVKIIPYLEPNQYYGIDAEKSLIDIGYRHELKQAGLADRLARSHLYHSGLFRHGRLPDATIDFGIAISVFTHLPLNYVRICLENTDEYFRPGGRLFASYFELPDELRFADKWKNPQGIDTTGFSDPYHYYRRDMLRAAEGTAWQARYIGEWNHPRGQVLVEYRHA